MEKHIYTEEEMQRHCSEVRDDLTKGLIKSAMEFLHIDEKWLPYLKDENQHFLFKTYFLSAIQEGMPDGLLERFQKCKSLDPMITLKLEYLKMMAGRPEITTNDVEFMDSAEAVETVRNEAEFYKSQVKELQQIYSDYSPLKLLEQYKELFKEKNAVATEKMQRELERKQGQISVFSDQNLQVDQPSMQNRPSFWERRRQKRILTKREELFEKCAHDMDYDMEHLELLKEAYCGMEPLEVLEHLVQAEEKKEDVGVTREWMERRKEVLKEWKNMHED